MEKTEGLKYQEALIDAGVEPGVTVGLNYRTVPLMPQEVGGQMSLNRVRTLAKVRAMRDGYITYERMNGAVCVEPLSDLYVEIPPEGVGEKRRIELATGPLPQPPR